MWLAITQKVSRGISQELVGQESASFRKIGCRCVLDEEVRAPCG